MSGVQEIPPPLHFLSKLRNQLDTGGCLKFLCTTYLKSLTVIIIIVLHDLTFIVYFLLKEIRSTFKKSIRVPVEILGCVCIFPVCCHFLLGLLCFETSFLYCTLYLLYTK